MGKLAQDGVSTHSRLKAAGHVGLFRHTAQSGFNTQPPEGGCTGSKPSVNRGYCFNTQPPEGGCFDYLWSVNHGVCFNTQPPEGGCSNLITRMKQFVIVSTHSRLKAAELH